MITKLNTLIEIETMFNSKLNFEKIKIKIENGEPLNYEEFNEYFSLIDRKFYIVSLTNNFTSNPDFYQDLSVEIKVI